MDREVSRDAQRLLVRPRLLQGRRPRAARVHDLERGDLGNVEDIVHAKAARIRRHDRQMVDRKVTQRSALARPTASARNANPRATKRDPRAIRLLRRVFDDDANYTKTAGVVSLDLQGWKNLIEREMRRRVGLHLNRAITAEKTPMRRIPGRRGRTKRS